MADPEDPEAPIDSSGYGPLAWVGFVLIFLTFLAPSITLGVIRLSHLEGDFGQGFRAVLQFVAAFSDPAFEWLVKYWQVIPTVFAGWLIAKIGLRRTSIVTSIIMIFVMLCITSYQLFDLRNAPPNTISSLGLKIIGGSIDNDKSTKVINDLISQTETVQTILIAWLALALGLKAPKRS